MDFAVSADHRIKLKESSKKYKYFDLGRELNKTMERDVDDYTNCDWCIRYSNYRISKGTGGHAEHPNNRIVENRLLRRVLETWRDLLSLKFKWKNIN